MSLLLKCTASFHITYELGQLTEIPLGTQPGAICIEKFYTKTVSFLLLVVFEKCRFCENYPLMKITLTQYYTNTGYIVANCIKKTIQ